VSFCPTRTHTIIRALPATVFMMPKRRDEWTGPLVTRRWLYTPTDDGADTVRIARWKLCARRRRAFQKFGCLSNTIDARKIMTDDRRAITRLSHEFPQAIRSTVRPQWRNNPAMPRSVDSMTIGSGDILSECQFKHYAPAIATRLRWAAFIRCIATANTNAAPEFRSLSREVLIRTRDRPAERPALSSACQF